MMLIRRTRGCMICRWKSEASPAASTHRLRALAQHEFLDLAGRGFRQWAEDDVARRLETRHALAAEGNDLRRLGSRAVLQRNESAGRLAPIRVRAGDDRGFHDRGVAIKHVLDLDRRDVLAARD